MLAAVINIPDPSLTGIQYAFVAGALVLLAYWLRGEITPRRFVAIWESDGVLSARQLLASGLALWGVYGVMVKRFTLAEFGGELMPWIVALHGIGGAVKAVAAYKGDTTVKTDNVENIDRADNVNVGRNSDPPAARGTQPIE